VAVDSEPRSGYRNLLSFAWDMVWMHDGGGNFGPKAKAIKRFISASEIYAGLTFFYITVMYDRQSHIQNHRNSSEKICLFVCGFLASLNPGRVYNQKF
jgi:hypothetical protein